MRHSRAEKAATHQRIVQIAARRFRERGIDGIGVADIMREAGLTVGGFYKHFDSREALVMEALTVAFAGLEAWEAAARGSLRRAILAYLSPGHRDDRTDSCPLAALLNDVPRGVRPGVASDAANVYTEQLIRVFDFFERLLPADGRDDRDDRGARARLVFSACVGALTLARAVDDPALSREILDTVADRLIDAFAPAEVPASA
ncbi:TetR/AcrR family transcriptional regulator [Cupriavidus plantarum]|uniref:TetR/AcrR family transcriptional regulator n=1 Tax=Cupriavidus plantarum TaxID=942865 RepID=UPI000E27C620|nr:TetR/AcrR family transcriptional regulator [Cupriavidus plantarum]REE92222.1 TetR family transcriptional regulator [Cupriavidus plantarum]RLK35769.1 TetR family transcriptional regulator [Cupriavidus plantarum]